MLDKLSFVTAILAVIGSVFNIITHKLTLGTISLALGVISLACNAENMTSKRLSIGAIWAASSAVIGTYMQSWVQQFAKNIGANPFLAPSDIAAGKQAAFWIPFLVNAAIVFMVINASEKSKTSVKFSASVPGTKVEPLDVTVGYQTKNGQPVVIKHMDRYLHTLVVGTTGTGKSSRVLKPMIWQDLQAIKKGKKLGITVIEPKGDFAEDVAKMCADLGIPYVFINPEDPASPRFNPLEGDAHVAAEITRTVFQALFGKQEAFFALNQAIAARNTVLLLKALRGDNVTLEDMAVVLREYSYLRQLVEELDNRQGRSSLTDYFRSEVLGMEEKAKQFQLGLRLQIDNIVNNQMLHRVLCGKSDINLDEHLANGGVLIVQTAMGTLGALGDAFGQFVIMHFQQAVFRRPGNEQTRTPHILYVDEFPRYVNPDFERLLAIGRSYRCATVLAVQTTAQIQLEERRAFKETVLETTRNKVILNLGSKEDAERFAAEFGQFETTERQKSYNRNGWLIPWAWDSIREEDKLKLRYTYTDLMELPKFTAAVKIVRHGQPLPPVLAKLDLSPWDKARSKQKPRAFTGKLDVPELQKRSEPQIVLQFPDKRKDAEEPDFF